MPVAEVNIPLRNCTTHLPQNAMVESTAKRLIVKAGRRGGKTVGVAKKGVKAFLHGRRVLYAAPTAEQTDKFWYEVKRALMPAVEAGAYRLNETERFIERPGTENRIRAKTAWNANTLRGDYADLLLFDEFQLMNEDAWDEVGAPMLLDNNGDAVFIFTPPSLKSEGVSKARDPRHASKMFKSALLDTIGTWEAIHFTSHENPFISSEALSAITADMSLDSYRREIMAEDDEIETSWLVYGKFNEGLCKIKRLIIPNTWPVYSGHDFGSANPAALFLAQNPGPEEPRTSTGGQIRKGDSVLFNEYAPGGGLSAFQHVGNFKEITTGRKVYRSVGGNLTGEDEVRQLYTAQGWPIQAPKFAKMAPQLDRVIGLVELNKLHIFEDLVVTLSQMANCLWELDIDNKPTNKIKDEAKYHLLACLRYIGSDFTPETVEAQLSYALVQDVRPSHQRVTADNISHITNYKRR